MSVRVVLALSITLAGCSATETSATDEAELAISSTSSTTIPTPTATAPLPTDPDPASAPPPTRPAWLGTRTLATDADGFGVAQPTPAELVDRRLPTVDTLPPPSGEGFEATIQPLEGEPLDRSTWRDGCPVSPMDLRYITVSFWGFDGARHTGELIVHHEVADDVVSVFEAVYAAQYPIEEMRVVTPTDLAAEPTGDGNNTASFVCRAVTGGTRFSEHAYGLAVDINPFHNPYVSGDRVLPELATSYVDRSIPSVGMIEPQHPVVVAFATVGWAWGGDWESLKDYQHFSRNNR